MAWVNRSPDKAGLAGISDAQRFRISQVLASPGTTGESVPRNSFVPSSVSRRSPACRFDSSGPWQEKQRPERVGRMSRGEVHDGCGRERRGRAECQQRLRARQAWPAMHSNGNHIQRALNRFGADC